MKQIGEALTEYRNKLAQERAERKQQNQTSKQTSAQIRGLATEALRKLFTETFQIDLSPIGFELEEMAFFYDEKPSRQYKLALTYNVQDSSSVIKRRCTCHTSFIYIVATGEVYTHSVLPGKNGPKLTELFWYTSEGVGAQINEFIKVLHYLVDGNNGTN